MSDNIEYFVGAQNAGHKPCRVSYTLGLDQPVICTIVGDQPLFYMDHEAEMDSQLEDTLDFDVIEQELRHLQEELEIFEAVSENVHKSEPKTIQNEEIFSEFAENLTGLSGSEQQDQVSLDDLKEILSQSRLAKSYLDAAQDHNVVLHYNAQVEDGEYNRRDSQILINPNLSLDDQLLVSARELRRHWQHRQGALIHPLMFDPDNAVLINRVQEADLAASMVRIAWELQLANHKGIWSRLESSSYADLAFAFAREAYSDFRTLNNGQACTSVFEAWFLSERCREEDRVLIQDMLANHQGHAFDLDESSSSITPALIAALGEMPFGKNYLSQHVEVIMNDPIFTDVRDRSNANFLWFIKFERSFKETEQELQNSGLMADDFKQAAFLKHNHKDQTGTQHENFNRSDAQIIQLYDSFEQRESSKVAVSNGKSADIIYLR